MQDIFLINFSGPDKPGLTSSLTEILASYDLRILDVGQAVVHETLALGILVRVTGADTVARLETDIMARSRHLGLQARFLPVTAGAFQQWAGSQPKDRYIITVLGREITAQQLFRVSDIIAGNGLNIDRVERLSARMSLAVPTDDSYACVELHVSGNGPAPADAMRSAFLALTQEQTIDIAFQKECVFRRNRRLFAFDMDSTLIQGEVIDELAKLAGVGDQVAAITAAAMRGELDFQQSFRKRVGLLRGLPEASVYTVLNTIPLVKGAERLISTLKLLGYKTAILSGGFNFFAKHLQERLGIDYVFANDLDIANGVVTGQVNTPIVDAQRKAALLQEIANKENISLDQVVAVGDGANDLPMLNIAGMGIAFHAKPLVRQKASHSLSYLGLDSLLYLIGIRDRDLMAMEARHP